MKRYYFWLLIVLPALGLAQQALVPNNLPTNNTNVFGKYGDFGVSFYKGQADINIPLEEITANGKQLPISLNYDGTGIYVNQHPGWVGQNWSLSTGGVITRAIQGQADELGIVDGLPYFNYWISYFTIVADGTIITEAKTNNIDSLKAFANVKASIGIGTGRIPDFEPDIFAFNVMGKTGKFFLDYDGKWKVISDHNFKVIFNYFDLNNFVAPLFDYMPEIPTSRYQKTIKGFELIDDQGYRYLFGMNNTAIDFSIPFFAQSAIYNNESNWIANGWHLTSVKDPAGNNILNLEYGRKYFTAEVNVNYVSKRQECANTSGDWVNLEQTGSKFPSGSLICPVYLKKITNNQSDEIEFKISDCNDKEMDWCSICYNGTPFPYLTHAGGVYSYNYTLAFQTHPFKGLKWQKLDTILYYKNGNLVRGYKLNYNNVSNERLFLLSVDRISSLLNSTENLYSMNYNLKEKAPEYISTKIDHYGYYDGTPWYDVNSTNAYNFSLFDQNLYPSRNPNFDSCYLGALVSMKFPSGGRAEFMYELNEYSAKLSDDRQFLISEGGYMSGLRIKEIKYYDNININPTKVKKYYYKKDYHLGGTTSSGCLSMKPKYVFINWLYGTDFFPSGGVRISMVSTNVLRPGNNLFETPVTYSEVVEENLDGSFIIYKFSSHNDTKDQTPTASLHLASSPYFKASDKSFYRGRLKSETYYSNSNELKKSIIYYTKDYNQSITDEYGILSDANKIYACLPTNVAQYYTGLAFRIFTKKYLVDSVKTTYHFDTGTTVTTQTNQYSNTTVAGNKYAFLMQKSITNSDGKVFMDYNKYSFDHTSSIAGQQAYMTALVNAHRFPVVYTEKKVNGQVVDIHQNVYNNFNGIPLVSGTRRREYTWVNGSLTYADDDVEFIDAYNTTFLTPTQKRKKAWSPENVTLNARGYVTDWTYGNHNRSYTYYPNDYLQTYTDVDSLQKVFEYDLFSRVKKTTNLPINVINQYDYHFSTAPWDLNYLKTKTNYPLATGSAMDSVVTIAYLDGLGRSVQQVHKYGAPDATQDVISKTEYDNVGRPYRSYEPIAAASNHGAYYTGAFGGGYTQTLYLADPLDRVSQTTPPAWYATQHIYGTNTVPLTNPEGLTYATGSLMLTTTTDPDSKSTDIYTDKIGRTVLQRQRDAANVTDTWTVYDDKSRPVKVYPPGSSPATPGLIFEYRYDGDDNVIYKKVPDAAAEEYRYSPRNLQTAMRNGVLAALGKWMVSHYDDYGRVTKRGYYNGSDPGSVEMPTIHVLLEEYFYDGYNGSTTNSAAIYKGKLKKSRIKVMEDTGANSNWVETEYVYDTYGRVASASITNHLGGTETKTYTYDYADNVLEEVHSIAGANGVHHVTKHNYDHQGRKKYHHINLNGTGERTVTECNYDHKNQIIERNLGRHSTTGTHQYLQSLDYTYNAQGWLTQINEPTPYYGQEIDPCTLFSKGIAITKTQASVTNTDDTDLFYLKLDYDLAPVGSGVTANQNGNITTMSWGHRFRTNGTLAYNYKYDHLNRVTEALQGTRNSTTVTLQNRYDEKFQYDQRGNITRLDRKAMVAQPQINYYCVKPMTIDSLTYTIWPGTNKLAHVQDKAPCTAVITLPPVIERDMQYAATQEIRIEDTDVRCGVNLKLIAGNEIKIIDSLHIPSCGALVQTYSGPCTDAKYSEGFNQQSINGLYNYDDSGNMTYDPNKKLTFYYNYHNLPYRIVGEENDQLQLLYGADGNLLQRKYLKNIIVITKRDYLRGVEYKSDTLESVHHPDGRAIKSGSDWIYEYWIKDHLGNVRTTFRDSNGDNIIDYSDDATTSAHNYYTFGMEWINPADTIQPRNLYRYNGKEMIEEMNVKMFDYGARQFMPDLGRFSTVDRFSDKYAFQSTYAYAAGNPIKYIDVNGDSLDVFDPNGKLLYTMDDGKKENTGLYFQDSKTDKKGNVKYSEGISFVYNDESEDRARAKEGGFQFNVVSDSDINKLVNDGLSKAGNNPLAARAGRPLDFFGKSDSPIKENSLNIITSTVGGTAAYNPNDFGNYLTGQAFNRLGYTVDAIQMGGHLNNLFFGRNDYGSREASGYFDSSTDQRAIFNGYYHFSKPKPQYSKIWLNAKNH
jgi:RHS repeat-associated protein